MFDGTLYGLIKHQSYNTVHPKFSLLKNAKTTLDPENLCRGFMTLPQILVCDDYNDNDDEYDDEEEDGDDNGNAFDDRVYDDINICSCFKVYQL